MFRPFLNITTTRQERADVKNDSVQMTLGIRFRPRLADTLKDYSQNDFFADLIAGLTVGIVALPLAMAFGIASGVKPEAGIFTAVVAGLLISALGGSRVQIGGPTGAFVVIVYGIIAKYGDRKSTRLNSSHV